LLSILLVAKTVLYNFSFAATWLNVKLILKFFQQQISIKK